MNDSIILSLRVAERTLPGPSLLLDEDVLIDAGTGVGDLELDAMLRIDHVFNDCIWPAFTRLPRPEAPYLRLREIRPGETVTLSGRKITALAVGHGVPAVGYWLDSGAASLMFTGDTGPNDALWDTVTMVRARTQEFCAVAQAMGGRAHACMERALAPPA